MAADIADDLDQCKALFIDNLTKILVTEAKTAVHAAKSADGDDDDDEPALGDQTINFACPLSLRKIKYPAKGPGCKHKQTFDFEVCPNSA